MSKLPLEEIKLRVRPVAADIGQADTGTRTVSVTGRVVDHEHYDGEEITALLHFTPKTMARSAESVLYMGFPYDDVTLLKDADEAKCAELLPEIVEFDCAPEEHEGKWQLKVKWVNKIGRGKFAFKKPLEGDDLRAFGAEMKDVFKNARGGAPKKPAPKPSNGTGGSRPQHPHPNAPGGRMDDDIPFTSCELSAEPSPIAHLLR